MKTKKALDLLELVSSLIFVGFLVVVLFFALTYWKDNILLIHSFNAKMFSVGLLITVVTVLAQWIDGRIKVIIKTYNRLKRRVYG